MKIEALARDFRRDMILSGESVTSPLDVRISVF